MMSDMVQLLRESVLIRSLLALMVVGVACYAVIVGIDLEGWFLALGGTVIGFFFRGVSDAGAALARQSANREATDETLALRQQIDGVARKLATLSQAASAYVDQAEQPGETRGSG